LYGAHRPTIPPRPPAYTRSSAVTPQPNAPRSLSFFAHPELLGLTHKEFVALHEAFCVAYATVYQGDQTAAGRTRKRRSGGGRKGQWGTTEQKLLCSLVYLKTYPRQALLGELFGLSQSCANRGLQRLRPMV